MKVHRIILLLTLILFSFGLHSQEWIKKMQDPSVNFYEVQKAFNQEFEGKSYERGKGMKQYWRWAHFMEQRVYPSGERIKPAAAFLETQKFKRENKQKLNRSKSANWQGLGPTSLMVSGPSPGLGRVNFIVVDPNDSSVIYLGTPAGGAWKSSNFGQNWKPITDDLPVIGVSGIAIDPNNSNIVYISTGDGDGTDTYSIGVLKSKDAGQTWDTTGFINNIYQQRTTKKIVIDPENSAKLYLAVNDGLYLSTDSGSTWNRKIIGNFFDIEFQPGNSDVVYASSKKIYVSRNGGSTFSMINNGAPTKSVTRIELAVSLDDSNYVYAVASDSSDQSFYGLYRSIDAGASFNLRSSSPNILGWNMDGKDSGGQGWYDLAIAASPINADLVIVGGINVWKSENSGFSWDIISHYRLSSNVGYTHADIHSLEYYGNKLYCGSDGGIFNSSNDGNNWFDLSAGLQISQFYKMAISEEYPDRVLTGAQDNGISYNTNGLWNYISGGDGMDVAIDPYNPDIIYYESQNGVLNRSKDAGKNFTDITSVIRKNENGAWVTPIILDPNDNKTIYAGYQNVWKSWDMGNTWARISDFKSSLSLQTLAVAPSNSNYIYTCPRGPHIQRTTDGGQTWNKVSSNLYNSNISSIEIHPKNPDIVWVSMSNYANGAKVFKTVNGGTSWSNISNNLPNIPVNTIIYDEFADGLYVGTDVGVYYTDSSMNNWVQYMFGLPNVIVNELEIHRSSGMLRAATYGRGVWETELYVKPNKVVPKYISDKGTICPGGSIRFRDRSFNNILSWEWHFQGGNPSTSTNKNPLINYSSSGSYTVTLIVSDSLTTDTLVDSNAVIINGPSNLIYPSVEGFQLKNFLQNQSDWTVNNPSNHFNKWQQIEYDTSNNEYAMYINNNTYDIRGIKHQLVSPAYNISDYITPVLEFDLAHKRFGSQFKDTLSILYSSKCNLYKGQLAQWSNTSLATSSDTLRTFYIPVKSDFVTKQVSLSSVIGKESVKLIFDNKSGFGNNIFIDNVKLRDITTDFEQVIYSSDYSIVPNPFINEVQINWSRKEQRPKKIRIYSTQGKLLIEEGNIQESSHKLNLNKLPTGIYFIEIFTHNNVSVKKLIKNK